MMILHLRIDSFRIDRNTGGIYVNNTLDKETTPEYNLTIFARNVGASSYNTTVCQLQDYIVGKLSSIADNHTYHYRGPQR